MKETFLKRIAENTLVSDGATGTNLQARGLALGKPGEVWVLEKPEEIKGLHKDFIDAGSDIILTCTFGGTTIRLEMEGLADRAEELNKTAVGLAREAAAGTNVLVAGSIGPLGTMLQPYGTLSEEDAFAAYAAQIKAIVEAGVDLLVIETQYDITEAQLAVKAARAQTDQLPLVLSFSYDRGQKTMMGVSPEKMVKAFNIPEVDLLGINCGKSLEDNLENLKTLKSLTDKPIWFKPNAGLPQMGADGRARYDVDPAGMGALVPQWVEAGAGIVGGCCGNSPEHVRAIADAAKGG